MRDNNDQTGSYKTMARIWAVTNKKGGSGKTSVAANIAACWAQGQNTLAIDLDSQGDLSASLGVEDTGEALMDALNGRSGLESAIRRGESGVDVAPAGEAIGYISESVSPDSVRRALHSVRDRRYGVVVIDCPPNLLPLTLAGWDADPEVRAIVPVDGPHALRAVTHLKRAWTERGKDLSLMRILITRHDGRRVLDRAIVEQARQQHGEMILESRFRESVVVAESAAWRRPLVLHAPEHAATEDIRAVAREVSNV